MVYTLTLNPAVDYVADIDEINNGSVNRLKNEKIFFGGKGINVSVVLKRLGIENKALGFIAGFTGKELEKSLKFEGVSSDFCEVANGFTRINVKLRKPGFYGKETELNGSGPIISDSDLKELFLKLDNTEKNDYLIISGFVPKSVPKNIDKTIIEYLNKKEVKVILDTSKQALLEALPAKPFLIKPNLQELCEILNKKTEVESEIIKGAKTLQKFGAKNVLVSCGSFGAVLVTERGDVFVKEAVRGKAVNTVGSGDSLVAGFTAGIIKTKNPKYALALGVASGSATAFSEGLATKTSILQIFNDKY